MFDGWDVVNDTAPRTPGFQIIAVAGRRFAIDSSTTVAAIEPRPPTHVPGTPNWVRGVLLYEGQVVPVLGTAERLGLAASEPIAALLHIEVGGEPFFIEVEELGDVVEDIELERREQRLMLGVIDVGDGAGEIWVLDLKLVVDISDEAAR